MVGTLLHKPLQGEDVEVTDYSLFQWFEKEEEILTEKESSADTSNIIKQHVNFLPSLTTSPLSSWSSSLEYPNSPIGESLDQVDQLMPQLDSFSPGDSLIQLE